MQRKELSLSKAEFVYLVDNAAITLWDSVSRNKVLNYRKSIFFFVDLQKTFFVDQL